jgi:hypothetical protein
MSRPKSVFDLLKRCRAIRRVRAMKRVAMKLMRFVSDSLRRGENAIPPVKAKVTASRRCSEMYDTGCFTKVGE